MILLTVTKLICARCRLIVSASRYVPSRLADMMARNIDPEQRASSAGGPLDWQCNMLNRGDATAAHAFC